MLAHQQNSLESSGYLYDPFTTDNIFGQQTAWNMPKAEQRNAEMMTGNNNAIRKQSSAAFDKPDLLTGTSNRQFEEKTDLQSQAQVNYLYLAAFAALVAVALR